MIYSGPMNFSAPSSGALLLAALLGLLPTLSPVSAQTNTSPPSVPQVSGQMKESPTEPDEEAVFLSVIEDIPLMPGLVEDEARAIVFDAAGGRLAETYVQGPLAAKAVREFYDESLPALGWRSEGSGRWVREGEALSLEIKEGPNGIDARFSLSPAAR